jgi:polysaccharide biosynthesis protein PslA
MVAIAPVSASSGGLDVAHDEGANRRGPFRPDRLATVRERLSGATLARLFRGLDAAIAIVAALTVAVALAPRGLLNQPLGVILPLLIGPTLTLWGLRVARAYDLGQRESLPRHLGRVLAASVLGCCAAQLTALAESQGQMGVVAWAALSTGGLVVCHAWAWTSVRRWRRNGRLTPNIVVVGATDNAARLIESALASREVNVLGIFDDRSDRVPSSLKGVPVLGDTNALIEHKILPFVDRVVITVTASAQTRVRSLIERLRVLPNAVTLFVDIEGQDTRAATLSRLADAPLTQVSGVHEDEQRAFRKRVQDLVLGTIGLIVAAPIMLLVAIAIRLDSPGPILFRQRRHGFNNEAIEVWKFRSMRVEATDHTARRQVEKNDDRVTRVGRFIRRTSLDELPQLFNVLRDEMSLVGPRPHPIGMLTGGEESQRLVAEYAWRHRMKPGITGWAQINGSRGPVHTREEVRRRVVLDVEYIERQSFGFDLYIMLMTLPRLLGDKDAVR